MCAGEAVGLYCVNHNMEKLFGLKLFCFVSLCVFFNQFIYFSISSSCDLQLNICIFYGFIEIGCM